MNENVCNASEPLVVVVVHSAPKNVEQRKAIRETWGSLLKVLLTVPY